MITNNPMQLKARIKNLAAEKHLPAQIVLQNYLMERLLERLSPVAVTIVFARRKAKTIVTATVNVVLAEINHIHYRYIPIRIGA